MREATTEQLKAAKCAETSNISEDTLFELYQEAYNQSADIDQTLKRRESTLISSNIRRLEQSVVSLSDLPALGGPSSYSGLLEYSFIFRYQSI